MLDGLRDLGKTIFLTTHYMEEAERLADRIAVIAGGRIIDEGTPATIGHRDLAASEIIFDLPAGFGDADLPEDLRALLQAPRRDGRIELHSAAPLADLGRLGSWAEGRGVEVDELEVHRPTLEDVYLRLTAEAAGVAPDDSGPSPGPSPMKKEEVS
jgi:ABC-2 type transport system ATP-binding protein